VLAGAQNNLGVDYALEGRFKDARNAYAKALDAYGVPTETNQFRYGAGRATVLVNLGSLDAHVGDSLQAERDYEGAIELYRQLCKQNRRFVSELPIPLNALGWLYLSNGNKVEGRKKLEEAADKSRQVAKENPEAYSPDLAMTVNDLALFYAQDPETATKADAVYKEAMNAARTLAQEQPVVYGWVFGKIAQNAGDFYTDSKRYKDANEAYLEALPILQKLAEDKKVDSLEDLGSILTSLAVLWYEQGKQGPETSQMIQSLKYTNGALDVGRHLIPTDPVKYGDRIADGLFRKIDILRTLNAPCEEIVKAADEADRVSLTRLQRNRRKR